MAKAGPALKPRRSEAALRNLSNRWPEAVETAPKSLKRLSARSPRETAGRPPPELRPPGPVPRPRRGPNVADLPGHHAIEHLPDCGGPAAVDHPASWVRAFSAPQYPVGNVVRGCW